MSDKSEACPMCGLVVGDSNGHENHMDAEIHEKDETPNPLNRKKKSTTIIWGSIVIFLLILFGGISFIIKYNGSESQSIYKENEVNNSNSEPVSPVEVFSSDPAPEKLSDYEITPDSPTNAHTNKGYIFGEYVTLQSGPSVSKDYFLKYLAHGTLIDILDMGEDWTKIKSFMDGSTGYILSTNIVSEEEFSRYDKSSTKGYIFTERPWLRRSPNMAKEYRLTYLTYGTIVDIVDKGEQWTKIRRSEDGSIAYIASENIVNEDTFLRFNNLFTSDELRQTVTELKYRKALLLISEGKMGGDRSYTKYEFNGIAFEKQFEDASVAVFDICVVDTDECHQCLVEFDGLNRIVPQSIILSFNPQKIEDVVKTGEHRYRKIGEVRDTP